MIILITVSKKIYSILSILTYLDSDDSFTYKKEMSKTIESIGNKTTQNVTFFDFLNMTYSKDKSLLSIKKPVLQKEPIINYKKNSYIQTEYDLFKKNKELLIKVNPIANKVEQDKENLDLYFLKKKLDLKYIKTTKK